MQRVRFMAHPFCICDKWLLEIFDGLVEIYCGLRFCLLLYSKAGKREYGFYWFQIIVHCRGVTGVSAQQQWHSQKISKHYRDVSRPFDMTIYATIFFNFRENWVNSFL